MNSLIYSKVTISELLKIFPEGFSIGPKGHISKIITATSHFSLLALKHPLPPSNGGYLVVEMIDEAIKMGNEKK